tara:strand:- start:964 stop:1458 length:495 start_codon:yes stop_codon:yes gene_type:complete
MQHIKHLLFVRVGGIALLVASLSCTEGMDDDDGNAAPDSAIAACECAEPSALDIPYDNTETELVGETVQDAITEVAQVDFADRVFTVDSETSAPIAGIEAGTSAQCGGGEGAAQALGGGCDIDNTNATLVTAELRDSSFRCVWNKPAGQAAISKARVTCLSLNP